MISAKSVKIHQARLRIAKLKIESRCQNELGIVFLQSEKGR